MKGIILAGGSGTRLRPLTIAVSKQLLPVYDKPMIFYPLTTLMAAGIKDILIITTPHDQGAFKKLLGDGSEWGIKLSYEIQDKPNGIAEAFLIGREFIGESNVTLILGDNLFVGEIPREFRVGIDLPIGAQIFGTRVSNPAAYGVLNLDSKGQVVSIEEKPEYPQSNFAVPGLYVFDSGVVDIAAKLLPSKRGELEITDLISHYLSASRLAVTILSDRCFWFDMGTPDSLFEAAETVRAIQKRSGTPIGSPSSPDKERLNSSSNLVR